MKYEQRVLEKLDEMEQYVTELEEMLPDEETYISDTKQRRACEKTVELAIECVVDVVAIIVSEKKLGVPHTEDDLIDALTKHKIITLKLQEILRGMKGFRNILVHKYSGVDDHQAYEYLAKRRDDFFAFKHAIQKYLQKDVKA